MRVTPNLLAKGFLGRSLDEFKRLSNIGTPPSQCPSPKHRAQANQRLNRSFKSRRHAPANSSLHPNLLPLPRIPLRLQADVRRRHGRILARTPRLASPRDLPLPLLESQRTRQVPREHFHRTSSQQASNTAYRLRRVPHKRPPSNHLRQVIMGYRSVRLSSIEDQERWQEILRERTDREYCTYGFTSA